jgi:hypothetical protein
MATRYQLYANTTDGQVVKSIKRILDDGKISSIPKNEANTDYQEYLEWAKTNTAEAAD